MSLILLNQDSIDISTIATWKALKGKICDQEIENLLKYMPKSLCEDSSPRTIQAEASVISAFIWSRVTCNPSSKPYKFAADAWGPGIGGGSAIGMMYHSYSREDAWDTFFRETSTYYAQGIAEGGGVFQITWFDDSGTPIGQFNSMMAGAAVFEIGGSAKWEHETTAIPKW